MMQCKQCQKTIDGDAYQMVADWVFCTVCFQQLLDKPQERHTSSAPDTKPDTSDEEITKPADAANRCRICDGTVSEAQKVKLGIWTFCAGCYAELARRRDPEPSEELPDEKEKAAQDQATAEKAAEQERIYLESRKIVSCHACGRQIHAGGSKLAEGEPYCPDCFYGLGLDEDNV